MIVFAVDIMENPLENGTDEHVFYLMQFVKQHNIPYVFSGTRNELGITMYGRK
jgi:hypothetical protein